MKLNPLLYTMIFFSIVHLAHAELVCKDDKKELVITATDSLTGYTTVLTDLLGSKMASIEFLRKKMPTMDDAFLQRMADQAKSKSLGKTDFGVCETMDSCSFSDLTSQVPVSCSKKTDDVTAKLEIFYSNGFLQIRCISNGTFEISNSLLKGTVTGEGTTIFNVNFNLNECEIRN